MKGTLIQLRQLEKAYQTPAGDFYALKGIDLAIKQGEFVAVLGKSGAGKSTLVNMITGLDKPTHGAVLIDNHAIHTMTEEATAKWRGRNVGVIFQSFQLLPMLTCLQNVMLPMDFANLYSSEAARKERALHLLDQVGLADHAFKPPTAVSGGQRQRVAIARALANEPTFIAADEPTGSLDSKTADEVFAVFEQLVADGTTIVMTTHDKELAARMSRIVHLVDGEICQFKFSIAF